MERSRYLAGLLFLLWGTGCGILNSDAGPEQTAREEVDAGNAETVQAEIHMGGGELHLLGGGTKLMTGSFRYSERVGRPIVRYDLTGSRGRLTVDSPKNSSSVGKMVNEWTLRMGSGALLEMNVTLGGGMADLDMSKLPLRAMEVKMGAGELLLNVAGRYAKDVTVTVSGGAGEARIRLPKDMGAVVDAHVGIGGIDTKGLTKRDGKYYNDAYAEGKPAVRVEVQGGVGDITLSVE
jgi:hypothetical protein